MSHYYNAPEAKMKAAESNKLHDPLGQRAVRPA
jgi:hypothetical protein